MFEYLYKFFKAANVPDDKMSDELRKFVKSVEKQNEKEKK